MKIIIAGSRTFTDTDAFVQAFKKLYDLPKFPIITEFIVGGANGADTIGENFAKLTNTLYTKFLPNWDKYGSPRAAHKRNWQMANAGNILVAFWDGKSKGTEHMLNCMSKYPNKPVYIFYFEPNIRKDLHTKSTHFFIMNQPKETKQ
ncbi:MAG: SLOG family protein [Minisyncoccia bacterium]